MFLSKIWSAEDSSASLPLVAERESCSLVVVVDI